MEIQDYDLNSHPDRFTVETCHAGDLRQWGITFEEFGDYLVAAGYIDGFDGQRVIWYGVETEEWDYRVEDFRIRRSRDRSEDLRVFLRECLDDDMLINFLTAATIVIEDDLVA